jgi:DNA modification methylase
MVMLFNDDCLEVLPTIKDKSVDMILADLPYGTTACKWDSVLPLDVLWKEYNRICKENGAMVFTCAQPFTTVLANSNLKYLKYEWIWEKSQGTNPLNAKIMPLKCHENILVFYKKKPTYNPQFWYSTPYTGFSSETSKLGEVYGDVKSKHRNNEDGSRYPKTVLKFKQDKGYHPTQKPILLMEYLIKTYTNENETVLDNTMGSGTTGVAAVKTNRNFIGIEKEKQYFEIAQSRILNEKNLIMNFIDGD